MRSPAFIGAYYRNLRSSSRYRLLMASLTVCFVIEIAVWIQPPRGPTWSVVRVLGNGWILGLTLVGVVGSWVAVCISIAAESERDVNRSPRRPILLAYYRRRQQKQHW